MSFPRYSKYKESGVEWLGQVPEHWTPIRYKNVFQEKEFTSGCTLPSGAISFGRVVFKNDEALNEATKATYQEVLSGEFLINPINLNYDLKSLRTAFSQINTCVSPAYIVLKPKTDLAGNYFKYQLHLFDIRHMKTLGAGVRQTITFADIGSCFTQMPPLSEQTRIAAFLDQETAKIDALVAEQQWLMELLKEKRQAVISHAVTKGLNPKAALKPSGIEWLGDVPAHWRVMPMRMISNVVRGASPRPAGDPRYFGGDEVPWVTVAEITKDDAVYLTETESFLTQEGATHSNLFRVGTLIYSNSGATLGVPKILGIDACANDGVVAFLNLDREVQAEFLYHYLASITDSIREKVKQGSGQPNLNTDIVKNLRFGLPPLEEQELIVRRITDLADQFGSLTAEAQRAIDLLQERRNALISAVVTGQIDVRNQ